MDPITEYWNRQLVRTARVFLYSGIASGFALGMIFTVLITRAALGE